MLLSAVGCTSIGKAPGEGARSLRLRSAEVNEQIDNVNYLIYVTHERYKEAKKENGGRTKEVSNLEVELGKLSELRDFLRAEKSRVLREMNGN